MAVEQKQIVGIEISEGVSKKTGNAYSIGTIHTMTKLAPPMGADNVSKGYMGDKYQCDVEILRKIKHLPFPIVADVSTEDVMRFNKRETIVTDVRPVETVKKAA
ncbi:hypothetical protein E9531_15055 [Lampropedia puyangensis]|uniref:Uncharacterized protein n=1 Tax=Lampropedia puyangensis TaxID=1330072 RepID=A0A4V4GQG5_9BURK|nr:hypothetical protein [Lampropedia puyangensis]THT98115.1 hypothetical protein E9531_15055 [Lampropedia puyangensis]